MTERSDAGTAEPSDGAASGSAEEPPLSPDEAFSLLGSKTRVAILRAVWSADEPLTFSEIRERVGRPDSGKFNYHLKKLAEHYLDRTDEGYVLRPAGQHVVGAVLAGAIDRRPRFGSVSVEEPCPLCGGRMEGQFDDRGKIVCTECEKTVMSQDFAPAGVADRSDREILRAFDRWTRHRAEMMLEGVCPQCAGQVDHEVYRDERGIDGECGYYTKVKCRNCRNGLSAPISFAAYRHPEVVGFFHEHGIDVRGLLYWELAAYTREFTEELVSEDPWRVAVTFHVDGDALTVTLDEALAVVGTERHGQE